jgi:VIT1/CCC1 family predicted Fe2+/Mn2+ transporter
MGCLAEKGRDLAAFRAVQAATDPRQAHQVIAGAMPPTLASTLHAPELEAMRLRLLALPPPPGQARLHKDDWTGAFGVFLLVFLSTFPVAIPFMVMSSAGPAMRVSNGVAIGLLFVTGVAFGRITGRQPVVVGIAMVLLGIALVGMTMALGG